MARQRRPQPPDFPDNTGPAGPSDDAPEPGTPAASPRVQRLRWAVAIAVVLIAHGLALFGLVRVPGPVAPEYPSHEPVEALLLPPPSPPEPPAQALQPPSSSARQGEPPPARRSPRQPAPPAAPPAQAAPADSPSVATVPEPPPAPAATPAGAAAGNGTGLAAQGQASGNGAEGNGTEGSGGAGNNVPYAAPPSVTLHYASFVNGVQNPDGRIHWQQEGGRYLLSVETRVLWFRFAFRSEGALGAGGLLPDRYVEERRKRTSATRFDRPAGKLVFESRGKEAALPPGTQDRFSVFLQLVGMVRANPSRYDIPGVTETFQVADTDEVEPMQVRYVGEEEVQTSAGPVRARHFVRLPRRAEDRRRVEIWLAEAVGWMPVKLQQTEPDGTRIELVLRDTAQ